MCVFNVMASTVDYQIQGVDSIAPRGNYSFFETVYNYSFFFIWIMIKITCLEIRRFVPSFP